jgi:hypothetical protein
MEAAMAKSARRMTAQPIPKLDWSKVLDIGAAAVRLLTALFALFT